MVREEGAEGKCLECDSYMLTATYKQGDRTPFPGNLREHTGCILCDTLMKNTIVNFFSKKQQQKKAFEDLTEEEKKAIEENRKKKEEKKKKKEEEAKATGEEKKTAASTTQGA